jgi:hypothetical protein
MLLPLNPASVVGVIDVLDCRCCWTLANLVLGQESTKKAPSPHLVHMTNICKLRRDFCRNELSSHFCFITKHAFLQN